MEIVKGLSLTVLPGRLAICRLPPNKTLPHCPPKTPFWSVTRTADELSAILPEANVPADQRAETGWRCLDVQGPLDFDLVGVLSSIVEPLAKAGVNLLAISTYNTDYILIREDDLEKAKLVLAASGHTL